MHKVMKGTSPCSSQIQSTVSMTTRMQVRESTQKNIKIDTAFAAKFGPPLILRVMAMPFDWPGKVRGGL